MCLLFFIKFLFFHQMFFISLKQLPSFLGYSNFCIFYSSFPHFPNSKELMKVEYDVMNWLAKICRHNFWNNWKAALYYLIKLGQVFWLYSFKIYYFQKNFLWVIYKIKRGPGTSFWCTFCAWFFHKKVPYLIHLSMDKLSISYLFSLSNYQTK